MKRALFRAGLLLAASVAVTACGQEATGQVAAVVNGEEITLQEINAELGTANIPEGADREAAQQAALQRIVERRLLAQAAREEGMDQTPEFLLRQRQLENALLIQLLSQRTERSTQVPDQAAIDDYIAENDSMFGERAIFTLDRIQFPMPEDLSRLQVLEDDHSMEEVAATLNRLNIEFSRGPAQMDSLRLGPERLERVRALPEGEPFVLPENGLVTVAVITGSASQPITGEQARPLALQAMRSESVNEALQQRLTAAKAQAEIEYQEGFAPPSPEASGTPSPAAPGTAPATAPAPQDSE